MQEIWNKIHEGLSVYAPTLLAQLRPGASEDEIKYTQAKLGIEFPEDIYASYQIHNGMSGEHGFIFGWPEFYSLERIFSEWEVWKDLLETNHFIGDQSEPRGPIKTDWWNIKWIPVLGNGGGDHCCLDLAPPVEGQLGQIITMWHETGAEEVLAPSFRDFLANFADDLNAGVYTFSEEHGGLITLTELEEYNAEKQREERQLAELRKLLAENPEALASLIQLHVAEMEELMPRFNQHRPTELDE